MPTIVPSIQATQAHGQIATVITSFGGIEYYVDPAAAQVISFQPCRPSDGFFGSLKGDLHPCTVINHSKGSLDKEDLDALTFDLALHDDVWTPAFSEVVIIQTPQTSKIWLPQKGDHLLSGLEPTRWLAGPYAIRPSTGEIFSVSRLYKDDCSAFITGSIAFSTELLSFQWLITGVSEHDPSVANSLTSFRIALQSHRDSAPYLHLHVLWQGYTVLSNPSIRGFRLMDDKLRFAVKDIIDVAGLETGLGNRSYRRLYPARTSSARCIDQLVDAGAILVGKTKTTQFAEGEVPIQWTDYLAPFNPRGDSYQSPSSSSAGSAAASAAYPWLDFTIGTDTGGSIRHPAGVCGTYGMRASTHAVSNAGVYSVSPFLDSLGVFARSAHIVEAVIKVLTESPQASLILPSKQSTKYKLLYPIRAKNTKPEDSLRWFPYPGEPGSAADAENLFEETIQKLESYLKCTRTPFNLDDLWRQTRPAGQDESLDKATGSIYTVLTTHTCVRETIDPFISDYKAANNNRLPFIDSVVKARHDHGRSTTPLQYENAVKSAKVFSQWVRETVFATSANEANEFPILLFPQSWGTPFYRDDPDPGPLFFSTFSIYSLSYLSGCPDCTVPIGEVSRRSRVTEAEMRLPVSLSALSPPGTDGRLVRLLSELEDEGILRAVGAGMRLYAEEAE